MMINDARYRSHTGQTIRPRASQGTGAVSLRALLRRLLPLKREEIRSSHAFWHEIDPPLWRSFELIDGGRSRQTGRLWRRRTAAGRWEYRQEPETNDEFLDRQW